MQTTVDTGVKKNIVPPAIPRRRRSVLQRVIGEVEVEIELGQLRIRHSYNKGSGGLHSPPVAACTSLL